MGGGERRDQVSDEGREGGKGRGGGNGEREKLFGINICFCSSL